MDDYTQALIKKIKQWGGNINRPIDTIYLGGGTPSVLMHRLPDVLRAVKESFNVTEDAEITLEMNPGDDTEGILKFAKSAGVNRLSIGAQSGDDTELSILGRRHTVEDTVNSIKTAREMGFHNISLDLMIGLPRSNGETLQKSLDFVNNLNPEHISAYILKIEENTVFHKKQNKLCLPDDDSTAEQYLQMCEYLENNGYEHYEISNFSKKGYESRHNLKYWKLHDYLGIGPAAHSCMNGKRFYYPRDIKKFIKGNTPIDDGKVNFHEEYLMLSLRTNQGLALSQLDKFGVTAKEKILKKCEILKKNELVNPNNNRITLTNKGMLLSNSIIIQLTECL